MYLKIKFIINTKLIQKLRADIKGVNAWDNYQFGKVCHKTYY